MRICLQWGSEHRWERLLDPHSLQGQRRPILGSDAAVLFMNVTSTPLRWGQKGAWYAEKRGILSSETRGWSQHDLTSSMVLRNYWEKEANYYIWKFLFNWKSTMQYLSFINRLLCTIVNFDWTFFFFFKFIFQWQFTYILLISGVQYSD